MGRKSKKDAAPASAAAGKAAAVAPSYCEYCEKEALPDPQGKHVCARCRSTKIE